MSRFTRKGCLALILLVAGLHEPEAQSEVRMETPDGQVFTEEGDMIIKLRPYPPTVYLDKLIFEGGFE